jgi:hypothetical protein
MKKILLALTALMIVGCDDEYVKTEYYTSEGLRVSVIDSCEYIHYSCGWGPEYTHKGNCRFCKERRQKELEELVIKLKK